MKAISNGVWPTMLTPFTDSNEIDYKALEEIIEWYLKNGVDGLFAVCQSSEMFYLSLEERVALAKFVVEKVAGRVPVIASGHVSDDIDDQIEEIKRISETGIDAFVLVSNRLAKAEEDDSVWRKNAEILFKEVPDIPFGIYECPYPYKRLISPDLLSWCASTGRFLFLKDTCCDIDQLKAKMEAVKGTQLKIFNANSATLLESLKFGISGFSGVMANFHPDLYVWLTKNWDKDTEKAELVQNFIGFASVIELQLYPVNAKYHMNLEGLNVLLNTRSKDISGLTKNRQLEVEQLHGLWKTYLDKCL
jgi:4-hydroxy-tetrahydrodipicolinate synthase